MWPTWVVELSRVLETAGSSAPALMEPQHARRLALMGPKINQQHTCAEPMR